MTQFVMVDEVFIPQGDTDNALRHQRLHAVLAIVGITAVLEAGGKAAGQTDDVVGGTEQPRTGIGGDPSAIKRRNERAALKGANSNKPGLHCVGIGGLTGSAVRLCCRRAFADPEARAPASCEKYGLRSMQWERHSWPQRHSAARAPSSLIRKTLLPILRKASWQHPMGQVPPPTTTITPGVLPIRRQEVKPQDRSAPSMHRT